MKNWRKFLAKKLHPQRLGKSTAAIAGFASAVSVVVGILAARAAPKGLGKLSVAMHISSKPLIVKLAPFVAGIAVAAATAAGLVKFYMWCREREDIEPEIEDET